MDDSTIADRGCSVAPRCTLCPLPRCKYETAPDQRLSWRQAEALSYLVAARGQVVPAHYIADKLGVGVRAVHLRFTRIRASWGEEAVLVYKHGYALHPAVLKEVLK